MGGGDLNLKKSWHPTTMKNMERVWKAEQKHEAEQKKIEELQKELAEERAREEIRHFAEDQGVVKKKSERLDWMYEGVSALANKEEYLLGRAVDKTFEVIQQAETGTGNKPEEDALPESIFKSSTGNVTVDLANKIREDPLLMIRKQEDENRKKLIDNPVRMKQLADMIKGMQSNKKSKKKKKDSKKRKDKHHSSTRKKDNVDDSSDERRKHRKKKSENGHHKSHRLSSHRSEQKHSLDNGCSSRGRPNETLRGKHKHSHSKLDNEKRKRTDYHSNSSSESDRNRNRQRHRRNESTASSSEDESLDRKTSHGHKTREEKNKRKSRLENDHRETTRTDNSKIIRDRRNSPKGYAKRQKRSSRSKSSSSSDSCNEEIDATQSRTAVISSRKQYGLIVRSNNSRVRKSRSRSPVKPREKVSRKSSSPELRYHKYSRDLVSKAKPTINKAMETKSFKAEKSSKKLDETEKQRRLEEMMQNAKQRDLERSANLKQHLEEEKREALLQMKTAGTDFITPILNKVADVGTVAERIKSNIYNIQRTKADLNKNFVKR